MTASDLGALNAGNKISEAASRLINSGGRVQALLDDLRQPCTTRSAGLTSADGTAAPGHGASDDAIQSTDKPIGHSYG